MGLIAKIKQKPITAAVLANGVSVALALAAEKMMNSGWYGAAAFGICILVACSISYVFLDK